MSFLVSEDMKLIIEDFSTDGTLNLNVRHYYDLLTDYCEKSAYQAVVHTASGLHKLA